jgi:malonate-semialdehyde dehydrogenase (acetylating)/methylmalonate-semialdehyde dehydrogenase
MATEVREETTKIVREVQNFIGGAWQAVDAPTEPVYNPATGEVIARTPLSPASEVDRAVSAATETFREWSALPVGARTDVLFRFRTLLADHFEEMAALVTLENGKDLKDARGEVRRGLECVDFACGMPTLLMGETVRNIAQGIDNVSYRFPLGVVAAITPFNFPMMVPLWTLPVAIGAGNAYILKPSERTPLSALRMVDLLQEAGLPPGVVSVVNGAKEVVDGILDHRGIAAVSFVGSQPVAEYVYHRGAANNKRVQALSGAKNAMIVMPDADLAPTVEAITSAAFGNAGERCLAGSVLVAVGEIADPLVEALKARVLAMKVGPGYEEGSELTPVIRESHRERVRGYIDLGEQEGATVAVDGRKPPREDGFFLGPTLLDHVTGDMRVAREEIFGPVLSIVRVRDLDEAIAFTNGSRYGNACSLFTRSGAAARAFRERAGAGMLGINVGVAAPMAYFPFNGIKDSFYGDLHATGKDGVRFFTENRVEIVRWF